MKSRGSLLSVGISFVASAVAIAGCILPEQDTYPNGESRPNGGIVFPPDDQGGAGDLNGGTGAGLTCGDGTIASDEACDDGNRSDGDGCSATCQVEACWGCSGGTCMPLAPNTPCINGTQVCDGKGTCGDCVPAEMACDKCKNCAGSACDEINDCASTACVTGVCRSANTSTCAEPAECASNFCQAGSPPVCTECVNASQCMSGSCDPNTGQCLAAIGEPCDASVQCANDLACTAIGICKGNIGAQCAGDHQCVSNHCKNGSCSLCLTNVDCSPGVCKQGSCSAVALPDDAYCVNDSDCASGKCTGFPRRCAAP